MPEMTYAQSSAVFAKEADNDDLKTIKDMNRHEIGVQASISI